MKNELNDFASLLVIFVILTKLSLFIIPPDESLLQVRKHAAVRVSTSNINQKIFANTVHLIIVT